MRSMSCSRPAFTKTTPEGGSRGAYFPSLRVDAPKRAPSPRGRVVCIPDIRPQFAGAEQEFATEAKVEVRPYGRADSDAVARHWAWRPSPVGGARRLSVSKPAGRRRLPLQRADDPDAFAQVRGVRWTAVDFASVRGQDRDGERSEGRDGSTRADALEFRGSRDAFNDSCRTA